MPYYAAQGCLPPKQRDSWHETGTCALLAGDISRALKGVREEVCTTSSTAEARQSSLNKVSQCCAVVLEAIREVLVVWRLAFAADARARVVRIAALRHAWRQRPRG